MNVAPETSLIFRGSGASRCQPRHRSQAGFSLFELVGAIVIIAVTAAVLSDAIMQTGRSLTVSDGQQVGAGLAQECVEYILASRRAGALSYAGVTANACNGLPLPSGYSRTVQLANYTGTLCPGGASCKQVTVQTASGGTTIASYGFVIANY